MSFFDKVNAVHSAISQITDKKGRDLSSDEFISSIQSDLENTDYASLLSSNPYLNFTRESGLWDRLGNLFGFRTAEDQALDSQLNAAREYAAQVKQLSFENDYNSPESKAQRQRLAGQNPDLLGTDGVSEAGEFAQEQTSPELFENDYMSKAGSILNMLISSTGSALGFVSQFKELESLNLKNDAQEISNFLQLAGYAPDYISQFINPDDPHILDEDGNPMHEPIRLVDSDLFNPFVSKRNKKAFSKAVNQVYESVKDYKQRYQDQNDFLTARKKYLEGRSDSRYNAFGSGISPMDSDERMIEDMKPLIDFMIQHSMDKLRSEDAQYVNEYDFQASLNQQGEPTQRAYMKKSQEQYEREYNEAVYKTLKNLMDSANKGDMVAFIKWAQLMSYINGSSTPLNDAGDLIKSLPGLGKFLR